MVFKRFKSLMHFLWVDASVLPNPLDTFGFALWPLNLLYWPISMFEAFMRVGEASENPVFYLICMVVGGIISYGAATVNLVPTTALLIATFALSVLGTIFGAPIAFAMDCFSNETDNVKEPSVEAESVKRSSSTTIVERTEDRTKVPFKGKAQHKREFKEESVDGDSDVEEHSEKNSKQPKNGVGVTELISDNQKQYEAESLKYEASIVNRF